MFRLILSLAFAGLCLAACAPFPPYRPLTVLPAASCGTVFEDARVAQRLQEHGIFAGQPVAKYNYDGVDASCWRASHEYTSNYDLFFVEFDDHGWLSATNDEQRYGSRLKWVMQQLNTLVQKNGGTPLNLVVYTHGWHHSAAAEDGNVNAFRDLLERAALVEQYLNINTEKEGDVAKGTGAPTAGARPGRRVVGVYVGWRGDSLVGPGIANASIWDRKLAAEEVAQGAVQELFVSLHNFYLAHACHFSVAKKPVTGVEQHGNADTSSCINDVQMLTIGHSFGALITYRALAGRLMANIVDSAGQPPAPGGPNYARSFGDLVVLINPAFEGVHFEALARAASERRYRAGLQGEAAQRPTLIILQSEGDAATKILFPTFRRFTTLFSPPSNTAQSEPILYGVGWTDRYVTHRLDLDPLYKTECVSDKPHGCLPFKLNLEREWRQNQNKTDYQGFGQPHLTLSNGLNLKQCRLDQGNKLACVGKDNAALLPSPWGLPRPAFMPIWVIRTDKKIIKDHNDFLNPHLVEFLRQIYYTVLVE
jgi:hypothetical protein